MGLDAKVNVADKLHTLQKNKLRQLSIHGLPPTLRLSSESFVLFVSFVVRCFSPSEFRAQHSEFVGFLPYTSLLWPLQPQGSQVGACIGEGCKKVALRL